MLYNKGQSPSQMKVRTSHVATCLEPSLRNGAIDGSETCQVGSQSRNELERVRPHRDNMSMRRSANIRKVNGKLAPALGRRDDSGAEIPQPSRSSWV